MATRFADIPNQQPEKRDPEKSLAEKVRHLAERLGKEADDRVSRRTTIEQRWLEDLRQYHGKYDDAIAADLTKSKRSALFINYTRAKTNAAEARLWDMLFPTDDKNWGIGPTPVPRLHDSAKRSQEGAKALTAKANEAIDQGNPQGAQQIAAVANMAAQASFKANADMEEAKKRAQAMEAEMEDQLRECGYHQECRLVIHDACTLGTGVLKGPIGSDRMPYGRRSWAKGAGNVYELKQVADKRAAFRWVDLWSFFWDPDARHQGESESDYQRHLMTQKDLRKLAQQPGFDKNAIRRLLGQKPKATAPSYLMDLRALTGADQSMMGDRYHVWEYHGCISAEEIRDLCACLGGDTADFNMKEEVDPLEEMRVIVWFCDGEVLRFGPHPMESGDSLYRVFNYEKDEASIAGFGIPNLMRDPQRAMNAAWRMMMDNAGLTTGPQLIIDLGIIEPASDGDYTMKPLKVWLRKSGAPAGKPGIEAININGHTEELAAIIEMCKQFVDDTTNIPVIAQGEQGTHTTQTAQGMTILMNSVNVVFRRTVKNWDDDITVPAITGLYDWNMQFSDRDEIKGDMEIDARGSSVLLVREMQSQNIGIMIAQTTGNPILLPMMKIPPMLRRWVQSFLLKAEEFVKTDEEMQAEAEQAAQQGQPPSPDQIKLEIAKLQSQTQLELAAMSRETEMIKLAQGGNITLEQISADLAKSREKIMSDERKFAAELAFEKANPNNGGSGGYVSGGPGGQADTGQGTPA